MDRAGLDTLAGYVLAADLDHIERLSMFPRIGRVTPTLGTRETVVPRLPFIVVYRIEEENELLVIAVFHAAQSR